MAGIPLRHREPDRDDEIRQTSDLGKRPPTAMTGRTSSQRRSRIQRNYYWVQTFLTSPSKSPSRPPWLIGEYVGSLTGKRQLKSWPWRMWESQSYRWINKLLVSWSKEIVRLNGRKTRDEMGILTGHCDLRYTHKTQGHSNLCKRYDDETETAYHFLCKCPILT